MEHILVVVVLAVIEWGCIYFAIFDDMRQCVRLCVQSAIFTVWCFTIQDCVDSPYSFKLYFDIAILLLLCLVGAYFEKKQYWANVLHRIGIKKFPHKIKQSFRNIFLSIRDMRLPK